MSGTLYLIPSALGETTWTSYLPPDTRDIACQLRMFVAENAKTARAELKRLGYPLPLREIAIEQLPERLGDDDIERLLSPLLAGHDVGLMSEAGCPAVADPGARLVRRAHVLGVTVRPLVGPSSLLLALMTSGLDGQRFAFHGYLPVREPERSRRITELEKESARQRQTQIFIEAPYRNGTMLAALLAACQPATRLCVAVDLTLPTQSVTSRKIGEWRRQAPPEIDRRPVVFLLLSGD
jgi:16S rRNA (cytidine1402-2'-O)-methyltransferase